MVNDIYYPHNKFDNLPANIRLARTRTRVSDSAVGFAGPLAPLSNMHCTPYMKDGQGYKTVEHGHGHSKAKFAKDEKAAQQILDTNCAHTAHNIARGIHAPGWDAIALPDLKAHMKEKFLQNRHCMQELLNTGTKKLLELTWDKKWAVGYGLNTDTQPGQNLTGHSLEELRTEFWDAQTASPPVPNPLVGQAVGHHPASQTAGSNLTHTPAAPADIRERLIRTSPITEV